MPIDRKLLTRYAVGRYSETTFAIADNTLSRRIAVQEFDLASFTVYIGFIVFIISLFISGPLRG